MESPLTDPSVKLVVPLSIHILHHSDWTHQNVHPLPLSTRYANQSAKVKDTYLCNDGRGTRRYDIPRFILYLRMQASCVSLE